MVGGHGRVATAHQIAPWSRGSDLLSPTAVGAVFRSTCVGVDWRFCALTARHGHRTAETLGSARDLFGWSRGYGPIALWTCKTLARRARRKVIDSISADTQTHVEMAPPSVKYLRPTPVPTHVEPRATRPRLPRSALRDYRVSGSGIGPRGQVNSLFSVIYDMVLMRFACPTQHTLSHKGTSPWSDRRVQHRAH